MAARKKERGNSGYGIEPKYRISDAQLIAIQLTAHGLNATEVARRLNSGEYAERLGPDYQIDPRSVQRWLKLPHIQTAILQMQDDRIAEVRQYEAVRTAIVLPVAQQSLVELVPLAIETIELVMEGNGGRGAMARLNAAKLVLMMAGLVASEKVAVGAERNTATQGMSSETFEQLRESLFNRVIYGRN